MAGVPLVRWLSRANVASRREARDLVRAGRVAVNGRVQTDGAVRVDAALDRVTVDGRLVRAPDPERDLEWWAVNKPRGVVATTADPEGRPTVMDIVLPPRAPGLAPVGRLDMASAGLLLLTNDSLLAAALLQPEHHVPRVYRVKARGHPSAETLRRWREDTLVVGTLRLGPMAVAIEREAPRSTWLEIALTEGKNRQIRRRLEAEGHPVEILVRVAFGPIRLGTLEKGAARRLGADEVTALATACGGVSRAPRTPRS